MTRLYDGAGADLQADFHLEVRRRDDQPEQFLWRDRLYLVREVLDHWIESGGWWQAAPEQTPPTGAGRSAGVDAVAGRPVDRLIDRPVDDGEREFWRVEAGSGRFGNTGVYDLCFDWSPGRWTVVRVQD